MTLMNCSTHRWAWLAIATGLLALAGCGHLPRQKEAAVPPPMSGALLVVRLTDRLETPHALQVEVALASEGGGSAPSTQLSARRQQSVPGAYADYFVALALPPQRYVITAIRDSSQPSTELASLLASPGVGIEVKPGDPTYLGRIVLAPDAASRAAGLAVEDHYDEDTLFFRTALPALRQATIGRDLITSGQVAGGNAWATAHAAPPVRQLSVDTLSAEASAGLSAPARDAFQKFMRMKSPRAFAIDDADTRHFAYFSGDQAVDRAMRECLKQAAGMPCRLLAVDDTLMSSLACNTPSREPPQRPGGLDACSVVAAGKPPTAK